MNFARESYSSKLIAEMVPLWKEHYMETRDENYGPLDPDIGFYEKAERMMRIFTMRSDAGALVGYQVFFISPDPHCLGQTQAVQDILYVSETHRAEWGYKFIRWCGKELEPEVNVILQRISARHDFGPLLERLGYELEDLTYSRRVKEVVPCP